VHEWEQTVNNNALMFHTVIIYLNSIKWLVTVRLLWGRKWSVFISFLYY